MLFSHEGGAMTSEQRKSVVDTFDVIAKIAIAVITGLWVLYTYPDSREKEFRKTYWDKQMSLLFDVTEITAKIATSPPTDSKRDDAIKAFWILYWGQMTIVESKCERCDPVDQAMIRFGRCLSDPADSKPIDTCDEKELEQRSIALGKAARDSIASSWDQKLTLLRQGCPSDGKCPDETP
jgi:hypothetical protein